MRALTIRQPWAWAIVHGGKTVENRTRNIAGDYRGPVAIHAGLTIDADGVLDDRVTAAIETYYREHRRGELGGEMPTGAIIGVANLWAVHQARPGCCPDRGTPPFGDRWAMADHWHLCLSGARALPEPIPYRGRLGLWTLPDDVLPGELAPRTEGEPS